MVEQDNASRPIQVFLDTGQFISLRESRQRGGNRDFFDGDNSGFSRHKSAMRQRIQDASLSLRRDGQAAGFAIVQMREEALAKSYRPLNALFSRANSFRLVGGGGIGEIFFQCTPDALDRLDHRIESRAEVEPRFVENEETGEFDPRPSAYRSELGGIEDIRLPAPTDRISFSAREAAAWLSRPDTLGAYVVELFRPDPTLDPAAVHSMIESLRQRLVRLGGVVALPLFPAKSKRSSRGHLAMSIQLTRDLERSFISLPLGDPPPAHEELPLAVLRSASQDVPVERHQDFLEQMAAEPMVRRISLPPSLEIAPLDRSQAAQPAELPAPPEHGAPVVGIIDGGVADIPALTPWRTGGTDLIDPADRDLTHGTFIAGLVAGARTLNPHIGTQLEPGGCRYFDIPLMPRQGLVPNYYIVPSEFFDQLEEEVIRAKSDAGVRVFNLSLGAPSMRRGLGYSVFAQALDDIVAEHDVVFVVSAGNLRGTETRAPWPTDGDHAVRLLVRGSTVVDNNGTSFAAPLVASTAATIDHRLDGAVKRETLIALLVHRAQRCQAMQHTALRHVARDFVGFGMAPPADVCLSDRPHSITLVFSESLASRRELQFVFSWPRSLVTASGKCRGQVDLTLAFTPPIDAQFDAECLRVQLEAYLHQIETDPDTGETKPQSRLNHHDSVLPAGLDYTETYLLKTGLKWTPVKRYSLSMPRGRGTSSNWRLTLRSSTRAGEVFPASGVPFTIVMTISDLEQTAPVYDQVRNEISRRGLKLADITVAHRVRPRS